MLIKFDAIARFYVDMDPKDYPKDLIECKKCDLAVELELTIFARLSIETPTYQTIKAKVVGADIIETKINQSNFDIDF